MSSRVIPDAIGVILAGGKSSRMGCDKASLIINGESLLLRARGLLLASGCSEVLLSGYPRLGWKNEVIVDEFVDAGPVSGIVSTVNWATHHIPSVDALVFIPIDAPLLSATLLTSMLDAATGRNGCQIDCSPLPLVLRATAPVIDQLTVAAATLRARQACSVRSLINPLDLSVLTLSKTTKSQLINVNTPAEWKGLRRELENRV